MSRRKQPNPAKLGDADTTVEALEDEASPNSKVQAQGSCSSPMENEHPHADAPQSEGDVSKDKEIEDEDDDYLDELNGEDMDDEESMLLLNGQQNSPSSSSEQASPASSCQSSAGSEHADGDEPFTMGATASTPYECNICKRAFARSSVLSKHIQTHTEQLKYSCSYCPRLFKHKRSRDRHVKLHTGDKNYKCQLCTGAFSRSDHLKIHLKSHDVNKPHRCEVCNRGFTSTSALATHMQKHGKKNARCSSASRTSAASSPSPIQNNTSAINHKNNLPNPPTSNNFKMDAAYQNMFRTNLEFPKLACMYCGKDFMSMSHMYQHIHTEHSSILSVLPHTAAANMNYTPLPSPIEDYPARQSNVASYPCDQCIMRFDTPQQHREHMETVHWRMPLFQFRDYPYDIQKANEQLLAQSRPTDLSHKRLAEDVVESIPEKRAREEPLVSQDANTSRYPVSAYNCKDTPCICSYCNVQLPNFKSFLLHMESHVSSNTAITDRSNQFCDNCPVCGNQFHDPVELGNHIFGHAATSVPGKCCLDCRKTESDTEGTQRHMLEEHTQMLYKCKICNDIFDSQINIEMHFKNKHIVDCHYYKCLICEETFHEKSAAAIHIRTVHTIPVPVMTNYDMEKYPDGDPRSIYNIQCPFCDRLFKDDYLQYMHILREHNDIRDIDKYLPNTQKRINRTRSPCYIRPITPSEQHNIPEQKMNGLSCDMCNRTDLSNEAELQAHKKLHHAKSKMGAVSLQCAYCSEHCKSRNDLENHMKTHQVSCGKGKHKCNICDEIFTSAITLADHKLTHCKIVSGNSCTQCKAMILDEQSFYSHQIQHSNSPGVNKSNSQIPLPANCVVCCQTLQTEVELKLHARFHLKHIIQKEFLCGVCNNLIDTNTGLKIKHSYDKNNSNIPVSLCKDCVPTNLSNISSSTKRGRKISDKVKVKQYACLHCPLSFDTEEEAHNHTAIHLINDGVSLECHLCRNILPSPVRLQAHLIEHNFAGIGQYSCYICSAVFTTATGLQNHIIGHGLNNRVYECNQCEMKFFFCTELENHKFSHILSNSSNQLTGKNGNVNIYDSTKQKKIINCDNCSGLIEETFFKEHLEICSKTKIKNESASTPDLKRDDNSSEVTLSQADSSVKLGVENYSDRTNVAVEIKTEAIQQ